MKVKKLVILLAVVFALSVASFVAAAQDKQAKQGKDKKELSVDEEMERDALKNLQAIRLYFDLRKAYLAALSRCEEVIAGYPNFSRIDEVLYYAGESSLRLSKNQGKQKPKLTPEQYRDDARQYFSKLVKEHPDSKFRKQAEDALNELKETKAKDSAAKEEAKPQLRFD
jgi:hypothetical protein